METNEKLDLPLDELELPYHTFKFLDKAGCKTLGDVTRMTMASISKGSRQFGWRSRRDVKRILADHGLDPIPES